MEALPALYHPGRLVSHAPRPADDFLCVLWSNGTLEMVTTESETLLFNPDDTRELLRYIDQMLAKSE